MPKTNTNEIHQTKLQRGVVGKVAKILNVPNQIAYNRIYVSKSVNSIEAKNLAAEIETEMKQQVRAAILNLENAKKDPIINF